MKYFLGFLFFFQALSGFSQGEPYPTYPTKAFSRIHYYRLKAGFERPKPDNGILLSQEQALTLLEILNDTATFETPQFRCFDPYDEFVIYNENDKAVAKIDIGFKCQRMNAEPVIPITENIRVGLRTDVSERLKAFIAEITQDLKPEVPEDILMIRHLVKKGETWEAIALQYDTTPDMIAAINNKSLMWTPTTDETLEIPMQFQFYNYPPLNSMWMNLGISNQTDEPVAIVETPVVAPKPPQPVVPVVPPAKVSTPAKSATPPKTEPAPVVAAPSKSATPQGEVFHVVKKSETLFAISKLYGKTIAAIQQANGMKDNNIKVGQKLKIPQ